MCQTDFQNILKHIDLAKELYYRLILIVGPQGAGKTKVLSFISNHLGLPIININLELTREMLDLTERQRILKIEHILRDIIARANSKIVLFDNIEILFDPVLKQDPLLILKKISRNLTLIIAFNGRLESDKLIYATSSHLEYKRYTIEDIIIVDLEKK
jgi:adenylate kinase family enzyme